MSLDCTTPAIPMCAELGPMDYSVGSQSIYVGDCLNLLDDLTAGSVDVIVTSPPYNLNIGYRSYDDNLPRPDYLAWLSQVANRLARVLSDDGSLFLNIGGSRSDPWLAMDVAVVFREGWVLQNHIVWVKSLSIGEDTHGHFKPINSERYLNHNHEQLLHFTKAGNVKLDRLAVGVPFKDKSNVARWGHARDRRCAGDVWFIPYDTVQSRAQKFHHPASFPVALAERCLRLHGTEDALVLDPFLGSGSTLVAAERLGMEGIGVEIDAAYARTAFERIGALKNGVSAPEVWAEVT